MAIAQFQPLFYLNVDRCNERSAIKRSEVDAKPMSFPSEFALPSLPYGVSLFQGII